jgi:mono/diheme cytochrome c family protein
MLKNHTHSTAGPYALLWTDPARNVISDEYWAWSVVRIQYHEKLDESMVIAEPSMIPKAQEKQVLKGYEVYVSHCAACHTIDHKGKASIGPDLKYPKTAFEYYPDIRVLKIYS